MPPPAEGLASRLFLTPALRTQPDRRLVKLVREGYEAAFEEIVRRYGKPLVRYAASIVGSRGEDVTQDAFSKALVALRRDDAEIELRPWLFRIVRNTALNELRGSPPSPEVLAEALAGGRNPAEELERREELTDLMRRLQALPEAQRAAIVMRELEGLSHDEIAVALGITGGGARQAIHRARKTLRDGAGLLVPLPLLQALMAGTSSGAAETAAGAGAAAGVGLGIKATAATVLVAGTVGAGVAVQETREAKGPEDTARAAAPRAPESAAAPVASASGSGSGESSGPGGGSEGPGGSSHSGEKGSGSGDLDDGDSPHSGRHRSGGDDLDELDDSGGNSGPGGGGDNSGSRSISSGPGGGDTEDNSVSSGSGGDTDFEVAEATEDSSGSSGSDDG